MCGYDEQRLAEMYLDEPHAESNCPYLHIKDCPGCGRSYGCYTPRQQRGQTSYGTMPSSKRTSSI